MKRISFAVLIAVLASGVMARMTQGSTSTASPVTSSTPAATSRTGQKKPDPKGGELSCRRLNTKPITVPARNAPARIPVMRRNGRAVQ
jgi:hypothetical protein